MLGMLANPGLPHIPNAWKLWVDHIMKKKSQYCLKDAALVHDTGSMAYGTRGFILTPQEIMNLKTYFLEGNTRESLSLRGKTLIVKSRDSKQLVAFSGSKYFIISRSGSMFIIVLCESRKTSQEAADWLRRVNQTLTEKGY